MAPASIPSGPRSQRTNISVVPLSAFPAAPAGNWLFEVKGLESGLEGVTGFVLR